MTTAKSFDLSNRIHKGIQGKGQNNRKSVKTNQENFSPKHLI